MLLQKKLKEHVKTTTGGIPVQSSDKDLLLFPGEQGDS